ncbi:methylamine dehydrogenase light chain [Thiomicrorhabdus sp. ZW0627]|uniref:methylamine dehydrogenase light chain n=1 Tax=Thiomicrorhabdus sp. ZW0627 TaxID=3039774 RepID=UPI00243704F2|nr:methylamine dehydrogenase light chain [Thiomicrorhabdus sp. ZW0627]MDG6774449.1 methylamine dehydrogenase light chain [Thiomicrorhabdus sp. ZW0627]
MRNLIDQMFALFDKRTESMSRNMAHNHGRRSFLAKAGAAVIGSAMLPLLPFEQAGRAYASEEEENPMDPNSCSYWRYCAIDGNLCSDCGGTLTSCPPGAEASKVSWVGTCHNPSDGKDYLVSYNDCCGRAMCNGTYCLKSERERPGYQMGLHNDINWCMANTSQGYHCTVAVLIGLAEGA